MTAKTGQNDQGGNTQNNQGQGGSRSQGGDQNFSGKNMDDINSNDANVEGWTPGQVGEVQNESQDGRLKENRLEGKTLGTTSHSRQAPNAQKDGEFINNDDNSDNNQ